MRLGVTAWSMLIVGILAMSLNTAPFARSAADCAAEADRASRGAGSPLGGMGRGAARGALFGAIVGNKKSARRGAALLPRRFACVRRAAPRCVPARR